MQRSHEKIYNVLEQYIKKLLVHKGNEIYNMDPNKIRAWTQSVFDIAIKLPEVKDTFQKFGILNVSYLFKIIKIQYLMKSISKF